MLDIKVIRENTETIAKGIEAKGTDPQFNALIDLDNQRKEFLSEVESLKFRRNEVSREIGKAKKAGEDAAKEIAEMKVVGDTISELDTKVKDVETQIKDHLLGLPNPPHESVPEGKNPEDNVVVREWGEKKELNPNLKDHKTFGEGLGLFDFAQGAKISGSGFPVYRGLGAKFERALHAFFLDTLTTEFGFLEIMPPHLVNRESMTGTGQLPKFEEQLYHCPEDDLFLIPTAEVPVTTLHAGDVLMDADLPVKYCAYTPCFRREAGSYGKDVRGFLRLHQFNKVEMVQFVRPDSSYSVLEDMVKVSESILQKLGLHYRVLELCKGDLGFGAAKCYDLEVWSPVEQNWLEVSSVSNFEDFQSRRANIKAKIQGKNTFLHTLNGSGLATPRVLVALLDQYQQEDGSFVVPEALRGFMGVEVIKP